MLKVLLKFSRPHYFITLSSISFAARPSPQGILCGVRVCACCCCVYMIKMTCAVNWIIVRERLAESVSLSHPDLAGSRGKTVSRHLELSPDAVDDHDFFSALSCSPCSTTCCCITVWAVESVKWFLAPQLTKQTLHSWNRQIQIRRFLFGVAFS